MTGIYHAAITALALGLFCRIYLFYILMAYTSLKQKMSCHKSDRAWTGPALRHNRGSRAQGPETDACQEESPWRLCL